MLPIEPVVHEGFYLVYVQEALWRRKHIPYVLSTVLSWSRGPVVYTEFSIVTPSREPLRPDALPSSLLGKLTCFPSHILFHRLPY
jgi:hypothetical protein